MFGMNGWCKPDGDLISRAAAIDDLHGKDPSQIWDTADIEVWVNALPSAQPDTGYSDGYADGYKQGLKDAQPERKTGQWLREIGAYLGGYPRFRYHCSVCGNIEEHVYADSKCANFCPNCGADMREVDDERSD